MKKMVLGVSMILACLICLVPPATAAGVPHGAPELSAFLASLAGPAPVTAAKRPVVGSNKSICTASANCGSSGGISCGGSSTCSSVDQNCSMGQRGSVTCDGVTTSCQPCPCDCNVARLNCIDACDPCAIIFSCTASTCPGTCSCNSRQCGL